MSFCIDSAKNNGYPFIEGLPEMPSSRMKLPYPYGYMVCTADENDGYPYLREINRVSLEKFSDIYFSENNVTEMYYNGSYITQAYCNDKPVFSNRYIHGVLI
ncbi:MAG: hypothetical protein K2G36_06345 [Ruminococcus sp.]|nr:hypothetical protein [Ruminococcus sp.]